MDHGIVRLRSQILHLHHSGAVNSLILKPPAYTGRGSQARWQAPRKRRWLGCFHPASNARHKDFQDEEKKGITPDCGGGEVVQTAASRAHKQGPPKLALKVPSLVLPSRSTVASCVQEAGHDSVREMQQKYKSATGFNRCLDILPEDNLSSVFAVVATQNPGAC